MYPGTWAATTPDKPALVMAGSGRTLTYAELDDRSLRLARHLLARGLARGDVVALLSDNTPEAYEVYWAALRSGLYVTAVNHNLSADEASYIVRDCGAKALVVSAAKTDLVRALDVDVAERLVFGTGAGPGLEGYGDYEAALAAAGNEPLAEQPHGDDFLYSSGTTGRPKGVKVSLPAIQVDEPGYTYVTIFGGLYGFGQDTVYLSPAPVYHAAPLRFGGVVHALGGTLVMMERFDAEGALRAIEEHRVTHTQMVPTMFVRLLKLDEQVRTSYDVGSLRCVVHAAAPCPVEVKRRMIDWLGPIVQEYYASTEANGATMIDSETWLAHPGSVGKALLGTLHICGEDGAELGPGEVGTVWFERDAGAVRLPQRPRQDRGHAAPRAPDVDDGGRPGLRRRGGVPLPHRPQGVHDHQRRGEHLPAGGRGPLQPAPGRRRHRRDRRPRRGDGGAGGGVRAALAVRDARAGAGGRADGVRPRADRALQGAARDPVPRRLPRTPTGKMVKGRLREQYAVD